MKGKKCSQYGEIQEIQYSFFSIEPPVSQQQSSPADPASSDDACHLHPCHLHTVNEVPSGEHQDGGIAQDCILLGIVRWLDADSSGELHNRRGLFTGRTMCGRLMSL